MKKTFLKASKQTALIGADFEYSYEDLLMKALSASEKLSNLAQKNIAIFSENSPEWVFALFAIWQANAVVVTVDAKANVDELAYILDDSDSEFIFTSKANLPLAQEAIDKLEVKPNILVLEDTFSNTDYIKNDQTIIEKNLEDLALVIYTSGTTGNPKGVMLSFRNLDSNLDAVSKAGYFFNGVRALAMLPFHHILPLMGTLIAPTYNNGKIVFPKSIVPTDIAEILAKYPVDIVVSVPRFYEMLHANAMAKIYSSKIATGLFNIAKLLSNTSISKKIFSSLHAKFGGEVKYWITGGAALDKRVWADLHTLGLSISEGFGMTECAPIISFPVPDNIKIGAAGKALPGIEIRIVEGEIAVKGDNVTSGYYKKPQETAESIREGWLFTGDLGYLDDEGFLFITGRRKEIIVLPNGKNLNPVEMEAHLSSYSLDIIEVGVLMYENLLQAIIRLDQKFVDKIGSDKINDFVKDNIILPYNRATATYKRIISFVITDKELPRTRVGKLKRHHLVAYLESISSKNTQNSLPEPNSNVYTQIKNVVAAQISLPAVPDAHIEMDLGLDSLGKVSLQSFIEENYAINISPKEFEENNTLRKLSSFIENKSQANFEQATKAISWHDIINNKEFINIPKPSCLQFPLFLLGKSIVSLSYKVQTMGEQLIPDNQACIIAPNHESYLDALFISKKFSKSQLNNTFFFAKIRNILKSKFIKKLADNNNAIIMDINSNVSESIKKIAQVLQNQKTVLIFPEGTRTKNGEIAEFKETFAILAKELNVPVVPVAIYGAYENIKVGGTFPKYNSNIFVSYMQPMIPSENQSYSDFAESVHDCVELEHSKLKEFSKNK